MGREWTDALETHLHRILSEGDLNVLTEEKVKSMLEAEVGHPLDGLDSQIEDKINAFLLCGLQDVPAVDAPIPSQGTVSVSDAPATPSSDEDSSDSSTFETDSESSEDEAGGQKRGPASSSSRKSAPKSTKKSSKGFGEVMLSKELAALLGGERMGRTEVIKRIWAIIRENNLQDPGNRSYILVDGPLKDILVCKEKAVPMFTMNSFINCHLKKPEDYSGPWTVDFSRPLAKLAERKNSSLAQRKQAVSKSMQKSSRSRQRTSASRTSTSVATSSSTSSSQRSESSYLEPVGSQKPKENRNLRNRDLYLSPVLKNLLDQETMSISNLSRELNGMIRDLGLREGRNMVHPVNSALEGVFGKEPFSPKDMLTLLSRHVRIDPLPKGAEWNYNEEANIGQQPIQFRKSSKRTAPGDTAGDHDTPEQKRPKTEPARRNARQFFLADGLAELYGSDRATRNDVSAFMVRYLSGLPKSERNKKDRVLDEPLQNLFKRKTMNHFNMNKFLSSLLYPIEE